MSGCGRRWTCWPRCRWTRRRTWWTWDARLTSTLVLWFIYGYSYEQIAQRLGIPTGTVRSRLSRGKAELVERLGEHIDPHAVSNPSTPASATDSMR